MIKFVITSEGGKPFEVKIKADELVAPRHYHVAARLLRLSYLKYRKDLALQGQAKVLQQTLKKEITNAQ